MNLLVQIASTQTTESTDFLSSLGIDWQTLIFQLIAFLVLVFIMGKWVYPIFVNIIEKREADIEKSTATADKLKAQAAESESKTAEILANARKQASEIVENARSEAETTVSKAEKRAKTKSEAIRIEAEKEIERDKSNARKDLLKEANNLVKLATEKVVGQMSDQELDDALIEQALKEAS